MMKRKILQTNKIVVGKQKHESYCKIQSRRNTDIKWYWQWKDVTCFFLVGGRFECLRIGSSGRLLRYLPRTCEYHKERGISWLQASQQLHLFNYFNTRPRTNKWTNYSSEWLGESCRTRQTRPTMSRVFAITFSTARAFVGQFADNALVCHFLRMTLSARWFNLWSGVLKIAQR